MPPTRPTYAFDTEGHTVVVEEPKYSGLAKCAGCDDELIAPNDGKPYLCIACSQEQDGRRNKR